MAVRRMPPPKVRSRWIGLRDAFDLTGQLLHKEWPGLAHARDDLVLKVRDSLWTAFDSGNVTVLLDYLRDPGDLIRLQIEHLHHWLFRMDPGKDVVFLGALPEDPWRCEIDRRELISALYELGIGAGPHSDRQERCRNWLADLMRKGPKGAKRKDEYCTEARTRFGVTGKEFSAAWRGATKETSDPHGWSHAGAPKRNNPNCTPDS
jgi:hypothetical protein